MCNGILKLIMPQPKMFLGADGLPLPEIPPLLCNTNTHMVPPGGFKKRDEGLSLCQQGHHFIEVRWGACAARGWLQVLLPCAILCGAAAESAGTLLCGGQWLTLLSPAALLCGLAQAACLWDSVPGC